MSLSDQSNHDSLKPILTFSVIFFFLSVPFFTANNIQQLVADSVNMDHQDNWDGFKWNGYISLGILYWVNAISLWFTPALISYINSKRAIALGAFCFNASLITFLFPFKYGLYIATIISGLSTSVMWNGQGSYVAEISNDQSITRDSGIFWSFLQSGTAVGNMVVAYLFQGKDHISSTTRNLLYSSLITFGAIGIVASFFLKKPKTEEKPEEAPFKSFLKLLKLDINRLSLLMITCFYTGLETTFFATLYGTSIGFTKAFGIERKKYAGESGTLIGLGQVAAGLLLISTRKHKKPEFILVIAYFLSLLTYVCVYINIPDEASLLETDEEAVIHSSVPLALVCAFLLGFIDGCYETQIFRHIIKHYAEESTGPFALYLSTQAIGMGLMYSFSSNFGLHFHCIMLSITCTIGTVCFFLSSRVKKVTNKDEVNISQIISNTINSPPTEA